MLQRTNNVADPGTGDNIGDNRAPNNVFSAAQACLENVHAET